MTSASSTSATAQDGVQATYNVTTGVLIWRSLAWCLVATTLVFLLNSYLSNWRGWPGPAFTSEISILSWLQLLLYGVGLLAAIIFCRRWRMRTLRQDAQVIYAITAYFIRACFWVVIIVGLVDMVISFLRVEELLPNVVGEQLATELGRPHYRGTYVHLPLIALAFIIAAYTRTLGFTWLALLVVIAELQIVIGRFIFSYEQAFMGDIVRFWYGALFLFASAHTLIEEGHVRVDVLYTNFSTRTKGLINAIGSILLGMSLCVVIIFVGMSSKTSIINSALINFEVSQAGFGMYIKYLMAGFLGVFAISMMLQFAGYMLDGIADWRGDPGKQQPTTPSSH